MRIESIYSKKIAGDKSKATFTGSLFYAIVPNQSRNTIDFLFFSANTEEARSVARALPLFIKDHFKLDPSLIYSSEAIANALEGDWDLKKEHS